MFEDALFATNRRRTRQQRIAAITSFVAQAAFVTILVALPLFFTEALPLDYVRSFIELPPPPPGRIPTPPETHARPQQTNSNLDQQGRVIAITRIPTRVTEVNEEVAPPRIGNGIGVIGAPVGEGRPDGVIGVFTENTDRILATLKPPPLTKPVRISVMDEGLLIRKVTPVYPRPAVITRTQGTVLLHAIISRDGSIQQLQAVSGPPLLIKAAMDAVAQWRYKPYKLNGEPVEVDTTITVNFKLGG